MRRRLLIIISLLFAFKCNLIFAYDGKVHKLINENATRASQLDSVLKGQLGMEDGIDTKLIEKIVDGATIDSVVKWLAYGGKVEDFGKNGENDWLSTRAYNHFHDPLENWDDAGFDSLMNIIYGLYYGRSPVSSIIWGLDPGRQDFPENTTGDWSWNKAKAYYYEALTNTTENSRNINFAACFQALGQVMHLLQDASVPPHTRNDLHIFPLTENPFTGQEFDEPIGRWTYEIYTSQNIDELNYTPHDPDPILLNDPQPESSYEHLAAISGLFDRNQYNEGDSIPVDNDVIGIAEYSNANFLSQDTMWTYQHPSLDDTNYNTIDWLNPESVIAEDGKTDKLIYIKKTSGEEINHLAAVDYWSFDYVDDINVIESPFLLDDRCWNDYAQKLIPRAVGYSAGLLDYFFRGRLEVVASPYFSEGKIDSVRATIKNETQDESMTDGYFTVVVRYTPVGGNPDGSDDKFFRSDDVNCNELQYNDKSGYVFNFDPAEQEDDIYQVYDSVKCYLVYKGTLGNEDDAVIGRIFIPWFNEDWDNGLDGNYDWYHGQSYPEQAQGETKNEIIISGPPEDQGYVLNKENIRYAGEENPRSNQSVLVFDSDEYPITPNTFLKLKMDEVSMSPESNDHLQGLILSFKDNSDAIFDFLLCQEGQCNFELFGYPAGWSMNLEEDIEFKIYDLFQNYGITFEEPLKLRAINFVQVIAGESEPSPTEVRQQMKIDYIRFVNQTDQP